MADERRVSSEKIGSDTSDSEVERPYFGPVVGLGIISITRQQLYQKFLKMQQVQYLLQIFYRTQFFE